jgi:hypothetical protein
VSRLWPERREVKLEPLAATGGDEPWQGALGALKALRFERRCDVTVLLSNHFVRYALVPWSAALSGAAEEEAYVRHHFAKIHGERARSWALRASDAPHGAPRLASAVDRSLIDALKACFPRGGPARLVSVQPALMAVFNRARGAIPKSGAWLALAEPERACVALHAGGAWRAVHNAKGDWLALLERARLNVDANAPDLVLLHAPGAPAAEAPGWKLQALA